jgi:DNA-binding NarL/FixJ family response regulator
MPAGGGLRATTEIARACPRTAIVILSADEEHEAVVELLAAGATSYLRKDQPGEEVAATLRQSVDAHRRLGVPGGASAAASAGRAPHARRRAARP